MSKGKVQGRCKDCVAEGVTTKRPAPHPGPRCVTHHRAKRRRRRASSHDKRVQAVYGLEPGQYAQIKAAQGGLCGICGPWTGRRGAYKQLAVDHDHACCDGPTSCGKCVRGLLCSTCNSHLGHWGDNIEIFQAAISYLTDPPARRVLNAQSEVREAEPSDRPGA